MLNTRKILHWAVTAVCCGLLPCGCAKEDAASLGEWHDVVARPNVGTCIVGETGSTPTSEELAIHSLRVYAFVEGQLVGHEFRSGDMETSATFWTDLTMTSLTTETVDFHIVVNEKAISTSGAEKTFTKNTTEAELNDLTFITLTRDVQTHGLLMFGKESKTINLSKLSNRQPIDPGHLGHTPLEDVSTFQLKRPIDKLGVFAAKEAGEAGELCVTGLILPEAGTRAYDYLVPQTDETLKLAGATGTGKFSLVPPSAPVARTLATNIAPEERQNPENYMPALGALFYPFENPWSSDSWNTPGDEYGNILKTDYTFDSEPREGLVYMPRIKRNKYYAVCCLMHNSGKITVAYDVADWEDGGDYQLEFDYPPYELLQSSGGGTVPYAQSMVYYNGGVSSTAGTHSLRFTVTGSVRQEWQPTLFDTTAADYELTVYQNVDGVNTLVTPPYMASDTAYEIRVRALKGRNVDKQLSLGIAYIPKWDPSGSSFLLINMQSGAMSWAGGRSTEKIIIKQVDIPTN